MKIERSRKLTWAMVERQLDRAVDQMQLLQRRAARLRTSERSATKWQREEFVRSRRMELEVVDGLYAVYYQYGATKARQLMVLEREEQDDLMACERRGTE